MRHGGSRRAWAALLTAFGLLMSLAGLAFPAFGQASVPAPASAPAQAASPPAPAASGPAAKLYVPAAQLSSWPLRVFVTRDLPQEPRPKLTLSFGHSVLKEETTPECVIEASHVFTRQVWTGGASLDGTDTEHVGTWVDFSLRKCAFAPARPVARAQARLSWQDTPGQACPACVLVSAERINIGNPFWAIAWAVAILAAFTGLVLAFVVVSGRQMFGFFLTEGRMSLSMVQMALWTYAVGFVVLYELLVRLDAADVPGSLIVLMFSSMLTAGASATLNNKPALPPIEDDPRYKAAVTDTERALMRQTIEAERAAAAAAPPPPPPKPVSTAGQKMSYRFSSRVVELFTTPEDQAGGSTLSLSRVQMLFWTILIILMFISKSVLSNALWEVPWTLVALMGASQLGYLGGKYGQAPSAK